MQCKRQRHSDDQVSTLGCCSGLNFYDNGGPGSNYGNGRRDTTRFVNPGGRLQVSFSSFSTEAGLDRVYIYDGAGPNAPLVGEYSGTVVPPSFISSTDTVTVIFYSDGTVNYTGWEATVSCVSGLSSYYLGSGSPTLTVACGDFYLFVDDGGTRGPYSEGVDDTVTFSPGNASQYLVAAFPYQLDLGAGDTLWVYAGSVNGDTLLAVFTEGSSRADTVASPQAGVSLTFRFKSNTDGNRRQGWSARIYCAGTAPNPVTYMGAGVRYIGCGPAARPYRFYDSGVPGLIAGRGNYGNYANSEVRFLTFASAGLASTVRLQVTTFTTEAGLDWLEVYDGASPAAPLIGRWSGTSTPPVIESSGPYLTVRFSSDGTINYPGWVARVSCPGQPLPPAYHMIQPSRTEYVCAALFYDDGGPEGDYTSPQTRSFTFCPSLPDSYVVVSFPYDFLLARGDTVWVYEGTASIPRAELLGLYTLRNEGEQIAATRPGRCLTFVFKGTSLTPARGWAGVVRCTSTPQPSITWMGHGVRRMCNLLFYDSGRPYRVRDNGRANYGNYANGERDTLLLLSPVGCGGVQVQFMAFNTETGLDRLSLYNGGTTASAVFGPYSGSSLPNGGNPLVSSGDSMLVVWSSDGSSNYSGWAAQVSCAGRPQALVNGAPSGLLCGHDSVQLTASPSGAGYTYLWNTGATTASLWVRYPGGTYYVTVTSSSGCVAVSPPVQVSFYMPLDTSVQVSGSGVGTTTLTASGCSSGLICTWINCSSGQAVGSGSSFTPSQAGSYAVVLYDPGTGCRDTSACYGVGGTTLLAAGEVGVRLWPNPSAGRAWLTAEVRLARVEVWNLEGRRVLSLEGPFHQAELAVPEAGFYLVEVYTVEGARQTLRWQVSR